MPSSKAAANKLYYRIGEVASLVGVDPRVLRSWEAELGVIQPARNRSKQRLYRGRDVEILREVKRLLDDEGLTLESARRRLQRSRVLPAAPPISDTKLRVILGQLKKDLEALYRMLS